MLGAILPFLLAGAYQGDAITVSVDAREAMYGLYHIHETVPARAGKLVLTFPKWIPGHHMPSGPLNDVINLRFRSGARTLDWQRDDVELFHHIVNIPEGVTSVDVDFDCAEGSARFKNFTPNLARLDWDHFVLYPAGQGSDNIRVTSNVTIPTGWRLATAMLKEAASTDRVDLPTVSLTEWIDSPGIVGRNYVRVPVGANEVMDVFGETPDSIKLTDEQIGKCKNLINEAATTFGAHHYRTYHFLVTLSDLGAFAGLEHHESSEDGEGLDAFKPAGFPGFGDLICHEYSHSWNGKYRRPAGLATPDYDAPMRGELLWVYEGMTQYLGKIFESRAGFHSQEVAREQLAAIAASLQYTAGRNWRPLEDTATSVSFLRGNGDSWNSHRRNIDYYDEAIFIWLEVDSIIRAQTNGQKSLDDFNKLFHGGTSGGPEVRPYSFDDVVQALNIITPYDWAKLLRSRAQELQPQLTMAGFENDGWRMVWSDKPNESSGRRGAGNNSWYTIGARFAADGAVQDVILTLPAGTAGLRPGMKVVGINNMKYSDDAVQTALKAKADMDILVEFGGNMQTLHVVYHDGPRYPHLERIPDKADVLSDVLKAHAAP